MFSLTPCKHTTHTRTHAHTHTHQKCLQPRTEHASLILVHTLPPADTPRPGKESRILRPDGLRFDRCRPNTLPKNCNIPHLSSFAQLSKPCRSSCDNGDSTPHLLSSTLQSCSLRSPCCESFGSACAQLLLGTIVDQLALLLQLVVVLGRLTLFFRNLLFLNSD